ncbi:MAG: hypothetical protein FJY60_08155, partial [Betaproteobacteria bacterium]|nr:hypothetical protein [Betaproteobacteria bacterium]
GKGTYYFLAANQFKGDKYVGEYKDGKKHGQGTYWFDMKSNVAGIIMTQTLPFVEPAYMAAYEEFERAAYS